MGTPVIAAMRGAAVGGGLTITLSCDFRLVGSDAKLGFVFTRRGIFPEGGSAWYLPRLVGMTRASDWMITGRLFRADEALASGLATSVHEPDEVLDAAMALAADLRDNTAAVSVAVVRQMLAHLSGGGHPLPHPRGRLRAHPQSAHQCRRDRRGAHLPGEAPAELLQHRGHKHADAPAVERPRTRVDVRLTA